MVVSGGSVVLEPGPGRLAPVGGLGVHFKISGGQTGGALAEIYAVAGAGLPD